MSKTKCFNSKKKWKFKEITACYSNLKKICSLRANFIISLLWAMCYLLFAAICLIYCIMYNEQTYKYSTCKLNFGAKYCKFFFVWESKSCMLYLLSHFATCCHSFYFCSTIALLRLFDVLFQNFIVLTCVLCEFMVEHTCYSLLYWIILASHHQNQCQSTQNQREL